MLILKRYPTQSIWIGEDIQIIILSNTNGIARIGINAPSELRILREELREELTVKQMTCEYKATCSKAY